VIELILGVPTTILRATVLNPSVLKRSADDLDPWFKPFTFYDDIVNT
jgi:hypothetical protein